MPARANQSGAYFLIDRKPTDPPERQTPEQRYGDLTRDLAGAVGEICERRDREAFRYLIDAITGIMTAGKGLIEGRSLEEVQAEVLGNIRPE